MSKYNTIHIFGYGETQVICEASNIKANNIDLKTLASAVDEIFSHAPANYQGTKEYFKIDIFEGSNVRFFPKQDGIQGFTVPFFNQVALPAKPVDAPPAPIAEGEAAPVVEPVIEYENVPVINASLIDALVDEVIAVDAAPAPATPAVDVSDAAHV